MANESWTCGCGNVNFFKAGRCVKCGQSRGDSKKEEKKPAAAEYDIEVTFDTDDDGQTAFVVQFTEDGRPIPRTEIVMLHDGKKKIIITDEKGSGHHEHQVRGKREMFTFRDKGSQANTKTVTILGPRFKKSYMGGFWGAFREVREYELVRRGVIRPKAEKNRKETRS